MRNLWIILGWAGAIAALVALVRVFTKWRSVGEPLPATPLERLGRIGLLITISLGFGLLAIVAVDGAGGFYGTGTSRGVFTVVLTAGIGGWVVAWRMVRRPTGRVVIDERDRAILARSFSVESLLVILSLVAWTIGLTEIFRDEGAVPLGYIQLIFWSVFIAGAFGRSLGIVLGYRKEPMVDA